MKRYLFDFLIQFYERTVGYGEYLWRTITSPDLYNYFYWLIGISVFFWLLEMIFPWRKNQGIFRKDFFLDFFYMFFNFFIFSLIGFAAVSGIVSDSFNLFFSELTGMSNLIAEYVNKLPFVLHIILLFFLKDFIQYWIHRLLHKVPFLWNFHKVHHSVKEMGFAAHLRYHWMENVVYKTLQYIPLAIMGFGLINFFWVDLFCIAVGHFNHSNFKLPLGPFRYFFNNPQMHIWHHSKDLPRERNTGVNFGITLSLWDYLFGTDYIPHSGKDIELGFENDEKFPKDFINQAIYPGNKMD